MIVLLLIRFLLFYLFFFFFVNVINKKNIPSLAIDARKFCNLNNCSEYSENIHTASSGFNHPEVSFTAGLPWRKVAILYLPMFLHHFRNYDIVTKWWWCRIAFRAVLCNQLCHLPFALLYRLRNQKSIKKPINNQVN